LAGIHWTFKYLGQRNFISLEEAEALSPLIPYIMKWAQTQQENHNHDILHGSLGPLYATRAELQFGPRPHTHDSQFGPTDLGLAHGIPGQAIAKNQAQQNGIIDDLRFLLSQADWSMKQGSVFPTKIVNGNPLFPSRMAWCYGDPGIGIALMQLETDYEELKGVGERVLTLAATRRDPENTRVDDPFICHGSAGLALIFFKGWLLSNNDKLREAARYWTKATIEFLEEVRGPKSGVRSPKSGDGMNDWPVSVLDGLSGIGLVLMAIDQGHLPGWEKGLFI
ncbi:MAG: hypothetical protein HOC82_00480, partial [Bacteroidetes bacterium]|nr:hypothetical protein [Bacteroidota bacterium]